MKKSIIFLTIIFILLISLITINFFSEKENKNYQGELPSTKIDFSLKIASKPILTLINPEDKTYANELILLDYSALYADIIWYNLDNQENITITSPVYFSASEGIHILYLYANNSEGIAMKNVTFSVNLTAVPGEIPAPPSGGGGGGGSGKGIRKKITTKGITTDKEKIKISLRQNETKTESLLIKNIGDKKINLSLLIPNSEIKNLVKLSKANFELASGEEIKIILEFSAININAPALFLGKLIIQGNEIKKEIPIAIEILPEKTLFNIKVNILEKYSTVSSGEEIYAKINLYDFKIESNEKTKFDYIIKDDENNILFSEKEEKIIEKEDIEFIKSFKAPNNAKSGIYILYAIAEYKDNLAISSDWFSIGEKPAPKPSFNFPYIILIIILFLILLIILYFLSKKNKKKQEKPGKKQGKNISIILLNRQEEY